MPFGLPQGHRGAGWGRSRSRRRGRGFGGGFSKGRLLLAVGIALFALISYYGSGETNPLTGDVDRVGKITREQEVVLGYDAMPKMVQQMGGKAPANSPKQRQLERIGNILLDGSGLDEKMREHRIPWEFTFTLLDDDQTVNAFALPGGPVFMTEALYDRLDNEAQVAGVLGHEIGHVVERHGSERMARSQLGQQLLGAAVMGTGSYEAGQLGSFVTNFINMSYGRDQELESDTLGLRYMADSGYDPTEMIGVMQTLAEASGGKGGGTPEWASTHPNPLSRIDEIKAWIAGEYPDGIPRDLTDGGPLAR